MPESVTRYAVYYAPEPGSTLAVAGAAWLGWDAQSASAVPHPELGLDLARLTETPRKYGLHGTLKPPMRLACPEPSFFDAVDSLAQTLAPVELGKLCLRPLGGFLAIVPETPPDALAKAAARIVQELDPHRAPLSDAELARRRKTPLSATQDALLQRWGYPYVMEEFRFHVTLTGHLTTPQMVDALRAAHAWFDPALETPHKLEALCIFAEDKTGRFHMVRHVPLRG